MVVAVQWCNVRYRPPLVNQADDRFWPGTVGTLLANGGILGDRYRAFLVAGFQSVEGSSSFIKITTKTSASCKKARVIEYRPIRTIPTVMIEMNAHRMIRNKVIKSGTDSLIGLKRSMDERKAPQVVITNERRG